MDSSASYKSLIASHIRVRQLAIWNCIQKAYDIDPHLNVKMHDWIAEGRVYQAAMAAMEKRLKRP